MYLGLYKFLRFRTKVHANSGNGLPKTLTEGDVDQLINDDEILPIWNNFKRELREDNDNFFRSFNDSQLYSNDGVGADFFLLHKQQYYIYCYEKYQRSSDSKWLYWRNIFLVQTDVNMTGCDLCIKPCTLKHNCALTLSPYFWDNRTIETYIQECKGVEASTLKEMLAHAKQKNQRQQGMFAYKEDFDDEGGCWDENLWSKRLAACLGKFIVPNPYKVQYTGDQGNYIYRNRLFYHRFHGAPDVTIKRYNDERGVGVATVMETETSIASTSDLDSGNPNLQCQGSTGSTVAALENSVKVEGKHKTDDRFKDNLLGRLMLEKSGELLSNMHIALVNKMLKEERLIDMNIEKLEISGILISRPSGISVFMYEMPVIKAEDLPTRRNNATLKLQTNLNSVLPESICVAMQKLLNDLSSCT